LWSGEEVKEVNWEKRFLALVETLRQRAQKRLRLETKLRQCRTLSTGQRRALHRRIECHAREIARLFKTLRLSKGRLEAITRD